MVMRRYHVTGQDDNKKYLNLSWMVQKLVNILKQMDSRDPFRIEMTDSLLEKLYTMGVIPTKKSLALCDKLSVPNFCRWNRPELEYSVRLMGYLDVLVSLGRLRLSTVLVRFCGAFEAVTYIEQGHIHVGSETVTDPALLGTRNMEDFVTWVNSSKIKRKVLQYNDKLDDYDRMQ